MERGRSLSLPPAHARKNFMKTKTQNDRRRLADAAKANSNQAARSTSVINLRGEHIKPYDVSVRKDGEIIVRNQWIYIGREVPWCGLYKSIWQNPRKLRYKHTPEERAEAIAYYEHEHLPSRPDLLDLLPRLKGQILCCWCAPEPCHGDVLKRLADAS